MSSAETQLVGLAEIAHALGVSRQSGHQITRRKGFPDPRAELAMGPVWEYPQIEEWARTQGKTLKSLEDLETPKREGNNKPDTDFDPLASRPTNR